MQSFVRRANVLFRIALFTQVLSLPHLVWANENQSKLELTRARISGELFFSNLSTALSTGMISWNPSYKWTRFKLQGILGVVPIKNTNSNYNVAIEYGLGASIHAFKSVWVEGFIGAQYWTDAPTHAPSAGGNLVFQLKHKVVLLVDQLFAGYTGFFAPNNYISELKVGIGIKF